MSAYLARAVQFVGPLHRSQRGVLEALAAMANAEGYCWPTQDRLARLANMSTSTVARCLAGLESQRLIRIDRESGFDGVQARPAYEIFPLGPPGPGRPHAAILAELTPDPE